MLRVGTEKLIKRTEWHASRQHCQPCLDSDLRVTFCERVERGIRNGANAVHQTSTTGWRTYDDTTAMFGLDPSHLRASEARVGSQTVTPVWRNPREDHAGSILSNFADTCSHYRFITTHDVLKTADVGLLCQPLQDGVIVAAPPPDTCPEALSHVVGPRQVTARLACERCQPPSLQTGAVVSEAVAHAAVLRWCLLWALIRTH